MWSLIILDNESSADETEHKYANLLVSSSMVELRSNHDYMEIDRLTLDRPTGQSNILIKTISWIFKHW